MWRRLAPGPMVLILIGTGLLISQLILDLGRIVWPSVAVVLGVWLLGTPTSRPCSATRRSTSKRQHLSRALGWTRWPCSEAWR